MSAETGGLNVNLQPSKTLVTPEDLTAEVRKLRNELPPSVASNAATGNLAPTADPLIRGPSFVNSLNNNGDICVGEIIDGSAVANCYRVNIERLGKPRFATMLTATSQSVIGATEINTFAPGTSVLLYLHKTLTHAIILGAIPPVATRGNESIHDFIHQASRNRVDEAHKQYLKLCSGGSISNWSTWRPFDNTHAGEWGAITTTGLKVTLDDFMVQMAVNEFTGVFGFYHDQLLRIGGYNLQTWTAGHERDAYMDQAEYNDTQGYSPYPWEAVGLLNPGQDSVLEYNSSAVMMAAGRPYYAHWENKYENQQPFHRTQKFFGYYGQGGRTIVCAPPEGQNWWTYKFTGNDDPPDPYESTIKSKITVERSASKGTAKQAKNEEDKPPIGLAEDNTALDGRRFIASAKGITLAKRLLLPVPARLRRPEDGNGDTEEQYRFAGKYGGGEAHTIKGGPEANGAHPHLQRAAGILDLHAYLFNYVGLHPFHWHYKDYKTWEQSELKHAEYNHAVPDYTQLKGSMYLSEPASKDITIDHRYGSQKYYAAESFISLLEDGGVVIGDGYGAEIRMCAGSITISAPGDVWFKPGKNAQIWAGRDFIMRANGSVDISTTEKNVRIKAEQNVMILAGNESSTREGGVLIESRAKTPTYNFDSPGDDVVFGGVVLRAKDSEVIGLGKNIYMRTTGGYEGTGTQAGVITLDASRGSGNLVTKSRGVYNYVGKSGAIYHVFRSDVDANATSGNVFKNKQTFLNAPLYVNGPIAADGKGSYGLLCRGSIFTDYGDILSKTGIVAPCPPGSDCAKSIDEAVTKIDEFITSELPKELDNMDKKMWGPLWYDDNRPGNADTIRKFEFSFRKDDEYRVDEFELFEDRWQQMARLTKQELDTWKEKPVKVGGGEETWPFPGKKKLSTEKVFIMQDFALLEADGKNFRDKDRGSGTGDLEAAYKTPKLSDSDKQTIVDNYLIIK